MNSLTLVLLIASISTTWAKHISPKEITPRIVQGQKVDISFFPHIVSINVSDSICAGSLISEEWILTAAHCVNSWVSPEEHRVRLGSNHTGQGGVERIGKLIITHEDYQEYGFANDIALIKISPVKFGQTIKAIGLPEHDEHLDINSTAVIAGFGVQGKLRTASIPYFDIEKCMILLRNKYNLRVDPDTNLCFGDRDKGGSSVCHGDNGSPLVVKDVFTGIVIAYHPGCEHADEPSIAVKVSHFLSWIEKHTGIEPTPLEHRRRALVE